MRYSDEIVQKVMTANDRRSRLKALEERHRRSIEINWQKGIIRFERGPDDIARWFYYTQRQRLHWTYWSTDLSGLLDLILRERK